MSRPRKRPGQLSFADAQVRLAAMQPDVGKVKTPVLRWRKLVSKLRPVGARPSMVAFQAVAGALANHANRQGRSCRPSIELLARETGLSVRTVQYALREMERRGLIRVDATGGRGRASEYELIIPPLSLVPPAGKGKPNLRVVGDAA